MKCQRLTARHKANTCQPIDNVCAHNGGHHHTNTCPKIVPMHCINCAKGGLNTGHMASNCLCPSYWKAVKRMQRIHPKNWFHYYTVIETS
jgi:hypothetical protein